MGRKVIDLTGEQFERWTVLFRAENDSRGLVCWFCECVCGNKKLVRGGQLRSGKSRSCGCLHAEITAKRSTTHGLSNHPLYGAWVNMVARCYKFKNKRFKNYGDRGITVCSEWINDFMAFYNWSINNGWKEGLTIDRIKNDGNYESDNCQFITLKLNSVKQRVIRSTNTSGYKGVYWDSNRRAYRVEILISGRKKYLGQFDNPKLAAAAYDKAAQYAGDNRSLNFRCVA